MNRRGRPTKTATPTVALRSTLGMSFIRDIGAECINLRIYSHRTRQHDSRLTNAPARAVPGVQPNFRSVRVPTIEAEAGVARSLVVSDRPARKSAGMAHNLPPER